MPAKRFVRSTSILSIPALASILSSALAGCAVAQMYVRPELRAADAYPIDDQRANLDRQAILMGPWEIREVERSGTQRTTEHPFGVTEYLRAWQTYSFALWRDGQPTHDVTCESRWDAEVTEAFGFTESVVRSQLDCELEERPSGTRVGRTSVSMERQAEVGEVSFGADSMAIRGAHRLEDAMPLFEPAGWEFLAADASAVGALVIVGDNALYLSNDLDEPTRTRIALAAAALFLYDSLEE